jgi:hypothetical protein
MHDLIHAVYGNGAFVPIAPCDLAEDTPVEVYVCESGEMIPPLETHPAKRAEIKRRLLERMSNAPLPSQAPKLTREQLHERR